MVLSYAIYQNEREMLEQGALQTARALLRTIDAELIKTQSTAMALSKSESLKTRDFAAFYAQASEVIGAEGSGSHYVLSDLHGQQILNTDRPVGAALPRHGNPEQVRRVVQTGQAAISDLYLGSVRKRALVSIDVPVFHEGKLLYVLSAEVMPEHFSGMLTEQSLPTGWIAAVLDAQDTVLARNLSPEKMLGRKATDDLRRQIAARQLGTLASRSLEGTPTFLAYEKSSRTRWTVAVGMTQDILYSDLYRLLALVGLSLLVFVASGAALAWFFSAYVRRSLTALGTATKASTLGEQHVLAPTTSGIREIDQLAVQFNAMHEAQLRMETRIREMAFYDPLTALANRRLLLERLQQSLAHNKRMGCHGALMFMDLDNFKPLNDAHGHAAGDLLLCEVANRLKHSVREVDTVARVGGDEFVVLVVGLYGDASEAAAAVAQLAEKIRTRLAEPYLLSLQTEDPPVQPLQPVEHHCSVSVGVTLFADPNAAPSDIMEQADAAMYQAKSAGRNAVRFAHGAGSPG